MLKLFLVLLLISCSKQNIPTIGIKTKPVYERDINQWTISNQGPTYDELPKEYPGYLKDGEYIVKGKVSLRGDLRSHWKGEKKSFRFRADKDSYYKGFREIDFLIPNDKAFELEPFGYELAKSLGLLVPEWKIINFAINSRDNGPYLMLEKWSPESMEVRGLPEGEIVRENNAWLDVIKLKEKSRYKNVFYSRNDINPLAFRIEIYKSVFNGESSPVAMMKFQEMLQALSENKWRDFVREEEAVNWTALMILMGSYHGVLGDNIKWYYHPYQRIFRPIPYDFLPEKYKDGACPVNDFGRINIWIKAFISDTIFKDKLRNKLSYLTQRKFLEELLNRFYERADIRALDTDGKAQERMAVILHNKNHVIKMLNCF